MIWNIGSIKSNHIVSTDNEFRIQNNDIARRITNYFTRDEAFSIVNNWDPGAPREIRIGLLSINVLYCLYIYTYIYIYCQFI